MTSYIQIAGSPKTAVSVLASDGAIRSLSSVNSTEWKSSSTVWDISGKAGNLCGAVEGLAVALASELRYLTSTGNSNAKWKPVTPLLGSDVKLKAVVGDVAGGFIVVGEDGKIHSLNSSDSVPAWNEMPFPLPFNVVRIAGNGKGLVVASNDSPPKLGSGGGGACSWSNLGNSPVEIDFITGDAVNGYVVYGESRLLGLTIKDGSATWNKELPPPPFRLNALSGNLADGLVGLLANGQVVGYCNDLKKGIWSIALAPDTQDAPSSNLIGSATASSGKNAAVAVKPAPAKDASVTALDAATS